MIKKLKLTVVFVVVDLKKKLVQQKLNQCNKLWKGRLS